jgi:hypothetical protein
VAAIWCGRRLRARLLEGPAFDRAAALRGEAFVGLPAPPRRVALRHPRRGERFAPLGLGRETTVARYLAAARVPAPLRPLTLVVAVDDSVVWAGYGRPGEPLVGRVAQRGAVAESSRCTLHVFQEDP